MSVRVVPDVTVDKVELRDDRGRTLEFHTAASAGWAFLWLWANDTRDPDEASKCLGYISVPQSELREWCHALLSRLDPDATEAQPVVRVQVVRCHPDMTPSTVLCQHDIAVPSVGDGVHNYEVVSRGHGDSDRITVTRIK